MHGEMQMNFFSIRHLIFWTTSTQMMIMLIIYSPDTQFHYGLIAVLYLATYWNGSYEKTNKADNEARSRT